METFFTVGFCLLSSFLFGLMIYFIAQAFNGDK